MVRYRIGRDGSILEDNPFVDDSTALKAIWSYGHRNPQGLAFHPETAELWSSEHGPVVVMRSIRSRKCPIMDNHLAWNEL